MIKLYPSSSAPAHIYGTPKMHKFSSSDSFPKLRPILSSIGTFKYNLARNHNVTYGHSFLLHN